MTTTSSELASQYKPSDVEHQVAERWTAADAFHAEPAPAGEADDRRAYSIVIPPPNVTSSLHLGHALNNTLQDILTRYHRMLGDRTLWMPGTDHAGIATQTVVDKRLQQEGQKSLKDYKRDEAEGKVDDQGKSGRDQFIEKVQAWKDEYEKRITAQLMEMGCSCDWDRQRFTMDDVCAAAVREAFFKLFKDGLIYRGKRLVNWDPVTQTALSDDEVEMRDVDGNFYYLQYPLVDKSGQPVEGEDGKPRTLTVATTRPETMLGDTAVAVNPKDPQARSVKGLFVRLPIVNRIIPIVEDDYVVMADANSDDPKARMATGFLKVTPAHDPNDYAIGQRHEAAISQAVGQVMINVMAPDASISREHGWPASEWEGDAATVDPFARELLGQSREDARKAIVMWFKENKLLTEIKPHRHAVGHSYRSHVPVEPYLSDQWYVAVTKQIPGLPDEGTHAPTTVAKNSLAGLALQALAPEERASTSGAGSQASGAGAQASGTGPQSSGTGPRSSGTGPRSSGTGPRSSGTGSEASGTGVPPVTPRSGAPAATPRAEYSRRNLPHWHLGGSTYFVTFRLRQGELSADERQMVLDACLHWHDQRADVHLAVVMPDHVHLLLTPLRRNETDWYPLSELLHSIKSYTAHELNKRRGSSGSIWQDESFDRAVRDEDEFREKWNYMQLNPVKSGLVDQPEQYEYLRAGASAVPADHRRDAYATEGAARAGGGGSSSGETPWQGSLNFTPPRYAKTFQTWHENIRDWCISRQLWWGHRIPVWYLRGPAIVTPGQSAIDLMHKLDEWETDGRIARISRTAEQFGDAIDDITTPAHFICVRSEDDVEIIDALTEHGFTQDPDVLDTWFSSALWPMSTLGWPNPDAFTDGTSDGSPAIPEGARALHTWNPTNTLCTAREIITLWVSRMVMFNLYFSQPSQQPNDATGPLADWYKSGPHLPFSDVFIHAMIQDGHGQKMSKSLGNGVDPADIIHSHGSDAMRFTLASMTTQTQDVRMPVDMICPHTGETFTPKFITTPSGHRVAAPIQKCPSEPDKEMVSSFGLASGQATPSADKPLARNTSEKFDLGRNFANKLWNATRFALSNLEAAASEPVEAATDAEGRGAELVNRWILSRLAQTVAQADQSLVRYEFKPYVDGLYDFVWRDFCDWYIEAVKPTLRTSRSQQQTLATVLDVTLRLLQPAMPFVTEKLWERLNAVAPQRSVEGVTIEPSELLVHARWPKVDPSLVDESAVKIFNDVRDVISAIRQVRTQHKASPRERLNVEGRAPGRVAIQVFDVGDLIESLANVRIMRVGADLERPQDAASAVVGDIEIYVLGLVDSAAEKERLEKQLTATKKDVERLRGRLSNENYVKKAPAKLVEQTQNELADKEREAETLTKQLADLG